GLPRRYPPPPTSTPFPYTTLFRSDLILVLEPVGLRLRVERQDGTAHAERVGVGCLQQAERPLQQCRVRARIVVDVGDKLAACLLDRKSTRLNSSHVKISYAVFCWK